MSYVYILSDHDEYGAENLVATLDRSLLMGMVEKNWPKYKPVWIEEAKAGLARHLEELSDEELCEKTRKNGLDCHRGWGGMQLHVVKLDAP